MSIIVIYILFLIILKAIFPLRKKQMYYVFFAGLILFLIASFRNVDFGFDTVGYIDRYFIPLQNKKILKIWNDFRSGIGKDPFFLVFTKVVILLGGNYQTWLSVISLLFCFSISRLIYKHSFEPMISFVALISLGYFFFSLTGLRQTIAISILLFSFEFLREKKLILFVLVVYLASLFHSSAWIFLIVYPIAHMKMGIIHFVGFVIGVYIVFLFQDIIRNSILIIGWNENIAGYADSNVALSISGFVIQLSIFIFVLIFRADILERSTNNIVYYNLLFLGLMFQLFALIIAEFFRLSIYFSIFSIILIPNVIVGFKDKKTKIAIKSIVTLILFAYILWNNSFSELSLF